MNSEVFTFSELDIAAAIRGLREALGRSEENMARLLGCSLPGYQKWEAGTALPGGDWLLRLLQLCPDEETRNAFRIRRERRLGRRSRSPAPPVGWAHSTDERERNWELAREAVDMMFRCGQAGIAAADARLRDFAQNLQAASRYYQQQLEGKTLNE